MALDTVLITDHSFESIDQERHIVTSAGFHLTEIQPICKTEDDVIRTCAQGDVLLVQWAPITRRVLATLQRAKYVVRYGVGINNIDLRAAKDLGVTVANVPDYCQEEVSNHALAMILSLGRRMIQDHSQMTRGGWGIGAFRPIPALFDMTLGLVGFGAIARHVAKKAKVFGLRLIACDPFVDNSRFKELSVARVDWATLVKTADIISLHCPLFAETSHLVNRETISNMKPAVIIINTARGPLIKEGDLIEALKSGRIGGAGLDVFEQEPLPAESPLRGFANVFLTSHAASVSERAVQLLQIKAAEAARDFLQGKRPASVITQP